MAIADKLLTLDEYFAISDPNQPTELVRGRIVPMNLTAKRHGITCGNIYATLREFARRTGKGRAMTNDACVITEKDPDTVRGPDVCYVSYDRLPHKSLGGKYDPSVPEVAFEVLSPSDRWVEVHEKIVELLKAGVLAVGVVDPDEQTVRMYYPDRGDTILNANEFLELPMIGDFRCAVSIFFED